MKRIFSWIFKWKGWTISGSIPPEYDKVIIVAAPHTSNWDFLYGLGALFLFKYDVKYLAKKQLFRFPLGWLLRKSGGIPVDRSKSNDLVSAMVEEVNRHKRIYLMFPPEGTRSRVDYWKSGFYYVALGCQIPVVMGFLDYRNKTAGFGPLVHLTGNENDDLALFREFYKNITPAIPENFNPEGIKFKPRKVD